MLIVRYVVQAGRRPVGLRIIYGSIRIGRFPGTGLRKQWIRLAINIGR